MSAQILTADVALLALRAAGLSYCCDAMPCRWTATCIGCRRRDSLILTEQENEAGFWVGPPRLTVGCRHRCHAPAKLAVMLSVDPDVIAAKAETHRWRTLAEWAIDFASRAIAA
jgi:hypothetical protein